jgi:hypothetical protein
LWLNDDKMTTSKKIVVVVNGFSPGQLFQYDQLNIAPEEYRAAVKALGRMVSDGILRRATPGRYYKPEKTVFGELKPGEEQLLKPYLFDDNRRIAYVTGTALYNRMGLTTQVSKVIQVASRERRIVTTVNNLAVKPVKSYTDVTDENYNLLEILDALKDIRIIPDVDRKGALQLLAQTIQALPAIDKKQLITTGLKYPPRTRALLGALLTQLKANPAFIRSLKNSLNPLSTYQLGITEMELPGSAKWNILLI